MTTTSGGNISIMDDNGDMWITPSAVDKGSLIPSDIILIKKDGSIVGKHKPSSEYPFHKAVYETCPDIKAIIHAHPPALVSFSITRQIPDTNITPHTKSTCGPVGYAKYELPGSIMLGNIIAEEFKKGFKAVIMENHGVVVGGTDMTDAFDRFETLEYCCQTIICGKTIGEVSYLSDKEIEDYKKNVHEFFPETDNILYSNEDNNICTEVVNFIKRACAQKLMISSFGTVSQRSNDNDFFITTNTFSRWDVGVEDIVYIKEGKPETGKIPSRYAGLHHEIYKHNPKINSVIIAQPPYLMAFAISKSILNVRTIPESWIFLQDVTILPFKIHAQGSGHIEERLAVGNPALIIENDMVIVAADNLLHAFDYLEVAELTAKSIVMAAPIGKVVSINNQQIEDLRRVFIKS
jgi:L-fuculose-phosphate aldolase